MSNKSFTRKNTKKSAFSLIELSIVLIIIGLLVAGITGGASLIRTAELRGVMTEARDFKVAVNSFFVQYDALPGDYNGTIGTNSQPGDGDGFIEWANDTNNGNTHNTLEGLNAINHLQNAGIIDDVVTQIVVGELESVAGENAPVTALVANNIPVGKLGSSGWIFGSVDFTTGESATGLGDGTALAAGDASYAIFTSSATFNVVTNTSLTASYKPAPAAIITPNDALSIDVKLDDGIADTGTVRGNFDGLKGADDTDGCYDDSDAVDAKAYNSSVTDEECALAFEMDI